MDLLLDILQGAGLAALAGIRPFPTALVAGGLAAGDAGLSFNGTDYAFLESPAFLAGAGGAFVVLTVLAERQGSDSPARPIDAVFTVIALAIGALLFAGSLADRGHPSWAGLVGGALCATLAVVATRGLLRRVRARLQGSSPVGLYIAVGCAAAAALVVLLPPLAVLVIGLLVRLALGARRRDGERYAGLRVLR